MTKKEQDYRERHRFWTGQTLTQFGTANNFFIVTGIAILGYFVNQIAKQLTVDEFCYSFSFILLIISAITTLFSLTCGSLTLLSRLYDLRLTRHINWIRIRGEKLKVNRETFDFEYIDIRYNTKQIKCLLRRYIRYSFELLKKFVGTLSSVQYFLTDDDISGEAAKTKFQELRERTLMLGSFSWMNFGWQIFWITVSIIIYSISLFV